MLGIKRVRRVGTMSNNSTIQRESPCASSLSVVEAVWTNTTFSHIHLLYNPRSVRLAESGVHVPFVRIINMTKTREYRFVLRSLSSLPLIDPREELRGQENILDDTSTQSHSSDSWGNREKRDVGGEEVKFVFGVICYWVTLLLQSTLINRSSLFASSFLSAMTHIC